MKKEDLKIKITSLSQTQKIIKFLFNLGFRKCEYAD